MTFLEFVALFIFYKNYGLSEHCILHLINCILLVISCSLSLKVCIFLYFFIIVINPTFTITEIASNPHSTIIVLNNIIVIFVPPFLVKLLFTCSICQLPKGDYKIMAFMPECFYYTTFLFICQLIYDFFIKKGAKLIAPLV